LPIRTSPVAAFAGVEPIVLPAQVPYRRQDQDMWCWAACCQMLLGYFGRPEVSQCDMAGDKFNRSCCAEPLEDGCNQGCFPEDAYDRYGIQVGEAVPGTSAADLDDALSAGRPVEVYYVWDDGGAHVALVVGREADGKYQVHDSFHGKGPRSFRRINRGYGLGRLDSSYLNIAIKGVQ